jgi:hypothetical protein
MRSLRWVVTALGAIGLAASLILLFDYADPLMRLFRTIIDAISK